MPYLGAGAYLLAVPRTTKQEEAAFELLRELAGKIASQQIVLDPRWGGGPTREQHLDEYFDGFRLPAGRDDNQALKLQTCLRETIQHGLRNPVLCLRVPREADFRTALTEEIATALREGKATGEEASAVMRRVAQRWDAIIADKREQHLHDYRVSVGRTR